MIERIESGTRSTSLREYAAIGAAVATDVRMRAYSAGDPIPTPYSVQPELDRFLRKNSQ